MVFEASVLLTFSESYRHFSFGLRANEDWLAWNTRRQFEVRRVKLRESPHWALLVWFKQIPLPVFVGKN